MNLSWIAYIDMGQTILLVAPCSTSGFTSCMQIKELPPMEVLQQCQYRRGKWIKCVLPTPHDCCSCAKHAASYRRMLHFCLLEHV